MSSLKRTRSGTLKNAKTATTKEKRKLHLAVENGNVDDIKQIIENIEMEKLSFQDIHCLVRKCIVNDRLDIVKCLIKSNAGINEEDSNSETLLHCAASHGRLEILKYLVECGANVNERTDYNETPLHYAIRGQHSEVVRELLNLSQIKEAVYDTLFSDLAVHIAAEVGNEEIFNMLLEAGYSMDSCFKKKNPIHVAASFGHWKIIKKLIQSGIDIESKTKDSITPLHFALTSGELSAVKFLLETGGIPNQEESYRRKSLNYFLDKENWNSQVPFKLMIERQINVLICLLNYFSKHELDKFLKSALTSVYTNKIPEELVCILLEYSNGDISRSFRCYHEDFKSLTAIVDHIEHLETLTREITNILQYSTLLNENVSENKTLCEILVARIVIMLSIAKNSKVESDLSSIKKYSIGDHYLLCKEQMMDMQKTKIDDDSDVTFHDILTKPIGNIANYLRCEKMVTSLESSYQKFSAYSEFLRIRVVKGKQRKQLIDASVDCFFNIIERNHEIQLPCLVIMTIFESLSTIDLRKMIQAFS